MTTEPAELTGVPARGYEDEEPPKIAITRRSAVLFGIFVVAAIVFLYFGLPRLAGVGETWARLRHGEPLWLIVAAVFEGCSFLGYVWLFRTVFVRGETRVDWRASYQITMAGVAATRLFAAAARGASR